MLGMRCLRLFRDFIFLLSQVTDRKQLETYFKSIFD
jgi:hypothetical protein